MADLTISPACGTTTPPGWVAVPEGWPVPDPTMLARARAATLRALSPFGEAGAAQRLADCYDRESDDAGATFTELHPARPDDLHAADLLAVAVMGADVTPRHVRRLLEPGPDRSAVLRSLGALPADDLALATPDVLTGMERLLIDVKIALGDDGRSVSERWATAALLCARKRPNLFPAHEGSVSALLGLPRADHRATWLVFRHLLQDSDVRRAIITAADAAEAVPDRDVRTDTDLLRVLEAALRTHAASGSVRYPAWQEELAA